MINEEKVNEIKTRSEILEKNDITFKVPLSRKKALIASEQLASLLFRLTKQIFFEISQV